MSRAARARQLKCSYGGAFGFMVDALLDGMDAIGCRDSLAYVACTFEFVITFYKVYLYI